MAAMLAGCSLPSPTWQVRTYQIFYSHFFIRHMHSTNVWHLTRLLVIYKHIWGKLYILCMQGNCIVCITICICHVCRYLFLKRVKLKHSRVSCMLGRHGQSTCIVSFDGWERAHLSLLSLPSSTARHGWQGSSVSSLYVLLLC